MEHSTNHTLKIFTTILIVADPKIKVIPDILAKASRTLACRTLQNIFSDRQVPRPPYIKYITLNSIYKIK